MTTSTLPLATGSWQLDPAHSAVYFKVRHLGLTNVRGRFNGIDAWLTVGDELAGTRFGATIDLSTVDTNQADRDTHLRSTDFFGVDAHPTMTFESSTINQVGDGEYEADGELTINDVTKPVTLAVEFTGAVVHPGDGKEHAGFIATTQIVRDDFGIDFNMPLGMDKYALGKKIDVEIDVQFTAPEA
ncbi:MAG: polyisoprenoid-binding protein [Acidimicrobiaceae bacterium]|nr:polyisoprenoid-binding protein [Acidimicrobiaceae bacterium]